MAVLGLLGLCAGTQMRHETDSSRYTFARKCTPSAIGLQASVDCQINRELTHDDLDRYCRGIVHAQVNEITDMRMMLCKEFSLCDYQPSQGQ